MVERHLTPALPHLSMAEREIARRATGLRPVHGYGLGQGQDAPLEPGRVNFSLTLWFQMFN